MSTPTTVKFRIAVSPTEGNGGAEKLYAVTLQAQTEGATCTGKFQNASLGEGIVEPLGDAPPPKDPPKLTLETDIIPSGDAPPPKDPPKVIFDITVPPPMGTSGEEKVYTLEISVQVEDETGSSEIQVTAIEEDVSEIQDLEIEDEAA